MENKYFTPDIEDFYVGVVYEKFSQGLQIDEFGRFLPEGIRDDEVKWRECTIKYPSDILHVSIALDKKTIRVLYLNKEQIEAEGWELIQIYPKGACIFQKGTKEEGCELTCDFTEHRVHFTKLYFYGLDDEYTRTKLTWSSLECKDINTFRKIIKLLGI